MRIRLAFLTLLVFTPRSALACTCMAYPEDVEQAVTMAYRNADVIFLGDAIAVKTHLFRMPQSRTTNLSVSDVWKGSVVDTARVKSNIGEIACGYKFKKGKSYLVFAHWDHHHETLTTSFCDLTRLGEDAQALIDELDKLTGR